MAFESDYIWLEGEFVPFKDAKLHFLTSSLHYGTSVFEGIRSYNTPEGPAVFRLRDHLRRLIQSTHILGMKELPYTYDEMYDATLELVRMNKMEECYIRPLIYINSGGWNLSVNNVGIGMGIAVWKWNNYLGEEALRNGIRANIASFPRHHPNITMTKGKVSGNYINSVLAKSESMLLGFDEAVMLDTNGNVSECTGENIFVVRNGVIYTPPRSSVLEGLTRESVMMLARDYGFSVVEDTITRDQLYIADEVFVTGTAAEIIALSEIDFRKIGSGVTGPVCKKVQELYSDLIHGKNEKYADWLDFIYTEETVATGTEG